MLLQFHLIRFWFLLYYPGHSLGGAAATCLSTELLHDKDHYKIDIALITFGSPRTLGEQLCEKVSNGCGPFFSLMFQNSGDIVTTVPPEDLGFRHFGRAAVYDDTSSMLWELTKLPAVEMKSPVKSAKMDLDSIKKAIVKTIDEVDDKILDAVETTISYLDVAHHSISGEKGYLYRIQNLHSRSTKTHKLSN